MAWVSVQFLCVTQDSDLYAYVVMKLYVVYRQVFVSLNLNDPFSPLPNSASDVNYQMFLSVVV